MGHSEPNYWGPSWSTRIIKSQKWILESQTGDIVVLSLVIVSKTAGVLVTGIIRSQKWILESQTGDIVVNLGS